MDVIVQERVSQYKSENIFTGVHMNNLPGLGQRFSRFLTAAIVAISTILASCGGGGGGSSNAGIPAGAVKQARFQGLIAATSVDAGIVDLAWFAATDINGNVMADATYEVHLSDAVDTPPSSATLVTKISAPTTSFRIKDLAPGSTVYVTVVAKSSEGVILGSPTEKTVKVSSAAAALLPGVKVMQPSTLGYSAPVITAGTGEMKFPRIGSLTPPTAGTILTGLDANGDPYLKKVVSSALVNADLVVQTTQPALSEVFSNFSLNLQSTLVSAPSGAGGSTVALGAVQSNGLRQDSMSVVVPMPSGSLTASDVKYADQTIKNGFMGGAVVQLQPSSLPFSTSWNGATINAAVTFNPTLGLDANLKRNWLGLPVDVALEASANGEVTLDLQLLGQWLAADRKSIPLASRKYVVRTVVAGIPVWFTPKMSLYLDLEAAGSANLNVNEVYKRTVSIGMARAFGGQWTKTASDTYTHEETIELGAAAGATASLRMVLDMSLYGMATVEMSPQMYVTALGVLNVNTNMYKSGPSLEVHAGVGYEVGAQADVSIFDTTLASWNNDGAPLIQKEFLFMQPAQPSVDVTNLGIPKFNTSGSQLPLDPVERAGMLSGSLLSATMFPAVASATEAVAGYRDDTGLDWNSAWCKYESYALIINPVYKLCHIDISSDGASMGPQINASVQFKITPSVVQGGPASLVQRGYDYFSSQILPAGAPAYMIMSLPQPMYVNDPYASPGYSPIVLVFGRSSGPCSNLNLSYYCNVVAAFSVDMSKATDQWSAPTVTQVQGAIRLREGSIKSLVDDMVDGTPPQDQSKAWQLSVY